MPKGVGNQYVGGVEVIGQLPDGRRTIEFDSTIQELDLDPKLSPLLVLLEKIGKKTVKQMKFSWQTDKRRADWVAPASTCFGGDWKSGAAATGTILVADADAVLLYPSAVLKIPSVADVNIIITNAGTSNGTYTTFTAATVKAGNIDLSTATAANKMFMLGDAYEVGTGMGTIQTSQPTTVDNYVQIVQTPIGVTTEMNHIGFVGENEKARQKRLAAIYHNFKLEKMMWFGHKHLKATGFTITGVTNSGTYQQTFAGGVDEFIATNVLADVGALTSEEFDDWITSATRYSDNPAVFCGELIAKGIRDWAKTGYNVNVDQNVDTYGLSVMKWTTYDGKVIPIVIHRNIFKEGFAGAARAVDLSDLEYVALAGLDTHLEMGIETPGLKQEIDEFRTWASIQVGNEERHGKMDGVTSIVQDSKRIFITNTVDDPVNTKEVAA